MHILLFILYSVILCTVVNRMPFFTKSGLRGVVLVIFFLLRVGMGSLHNWIAYRYYPQHGDIWTFFQNSFLTRQELLSDLMAFWAHNSTLAYLAHNLIIGLQVILNIFSFDNLYINTLLFSFLSFAGTIALFRAFNSFFNSKFNSKLNSNLICSLPVLLLPSTLFWTSCIHTEGILYLLLGFLFFNLNQLLRGADEASPSIRRPLLCFFLFLVVIFFRPGIIPGLVPALGFWLLAEKYRSDKSFRYATPLPTILLVTSVIFLILAFSGVFHAGFQYICDRQRDFLAMTGNSRLYLPPLEPSWGSFVKVLPIAVLNGFFQPLPGSGGQSIYLVFSWESIVIWGIFVFALFRFLPVFGGKPFFFAKSPFEASPVFTIGITFLLFALINMIIIGYTVPFAGAIIRYRSIFLPFFLAPALYILGSFKLTQKFNGWLQKSLLSPGIGFAIPS
ncbi:hypothetical protein ACX0G9_28585 [Flavitalea flava]